MEDTQVNPIQVSCGGCTICCKVLQVNDVPGGPKPAGTLCPFLTLEDNGCKIYTDRPGSCHAFECMYIKLARRPDIKTPVELRPDKSGVMFMHNPQRLYFTAHVWDPKRPDAWKDPEPLAVILKILGDRLRVIVTWGLTPRKLLLQSNGNGGYVEQELEMGIPDVNGEQHGTL